VRLRDFAACDEMEAKWREMCDVGEAGNPQSRRRQRVEMRAVIVCGTLSAFTCYSRERPMSHLCRSAGLAAVFETNAGDGQWPAIQTDDSSVLSAARRALCSKPGSRWSPASTAPRTREGRFARPITGEHKQAPKYPQLR